MNTEQKYKVGVTIWKALAALLIATTGVGATLAALEIPVDWTEFQAAWPALVYPVLYGVFTAVKNYIKNRRNGLIEQ